MLKYQFLKLLLVNHDHFSDCSHNHQAIALFLLSSCFCVVVASFGQPNPTQPNPTQQHRSFFFIFTVALHFLPLIHTHEHTRTPQVSIRISRSSSRRRRKGPTTARERKNEKRTEHCGGGFQQLFWARTFRCLRQLVRCSFIGACIDWLAVRKNSEQHGQKVEAAPRSA